MGGSLDRRRLLRGLGGALGAGAFAGCLGDDQSWLGSEESRLTSLQEWPPDADEDELEFWSWQTYWRNQALAFRFVGDLEEIDGEIVPPVEQYRRLANGESIDVVQLPSRQFDRAREDGLLQPIPADQFPEWEASREMDAELYAHDLEFYRTDGEFYGAPQTPMYDGLAYHSRRLDFEPDSWSFLWDDEYAGELAMPADPVLACQIAALYTGQNPNDPDDFEDVEAALQQQQPLLDSYWTEWLDCWRQFGDDELVGAVMPTPRLCLCSEDGTPINRTAPKEGVTYGYSTLAVPQSAENPWAGLRFVDWGLGFKTGTNVYWHPDEWELYHARALTDDIRSQYVEIATGLGIEPETA